jgi:5'-phosphate synthase pdxT subunit
MNIGVLALQGGYQAHITALRQHPVETTLVRNTQALECTDALIIPGGESAVFIKLSHESALWDALLAYKKPILGTCAGAILLAKKVVSPSQATLNRIEITIKRNAYGRQLASEVKTGRCLVTQSEIEMVFIRAPKIIAMDKNSVKILAEYQGYPVAVQENNCIAATFHPELSLANTLHPYFIQQIKK